jgi:hypothetical protein
MTRKDPFGTEKARRHMKVYEIARLINWPKSSSLERGSVKGLLILEGRVVVENSGLGVSTQNFIPLVFE